MSEDNMYIVSIGADPELFVKQGDKVSSVIGHLGGTKWEPRKLNGYGIQEDNVLAEFSMPPCDMYRGWQHFDAVVNQGIREINKQLRSAGLYTGRESSHIYTEDQLKSYGPAAMEFGCDPDFNAYTGEQNPAPDKSTLLRTAGGHVHVGLGDRVADDEQAVRMVMQAMDLYLGVPSVILDPDNRRRELYGKAGAYRWKPYGGEYRTLSNFWIHSSRLRRWVFDATTIACRKANNISLIHKRIDAQRIQDCINTGNKEMALDILHEAAIDLQPYGFEDVVKQVEEEVKNAQAA